MNQCTDKKYSDMIHAYELGLLDENETLQFESHLCECDYCFNRVREFHQLAMGMRIDTEIRDIASEASQITEETAQKSGFNFRALIKSSAPAVIALAIIILLVVLPGKPSFDRYGEALAAKNKILVLPFTDLSGQEEQPNLGDITASLLIADLSQARHLSIVSTAYYLDASKVSGLDPDATPGVHQALEIARRTGARWIVGGDILQLDSNIVISFQVIDQASGEVFGSDKIIVRYNRNILAAIDSLSIAVWNMLQLPSKFKTEFDGRVADVTTSSPKAFYYYLQGLEELSDFHIPEAIAHFDKAVNIDSTFAMAYYYLAKYSDPKLITMAVHYLDNTTPREKMLIKGYQMFQNKDYAGYEAMLKEIARDFPDEKSAYFDLGGYYFRLGYYDRAITNLNKAIDLDSLYETAYNTLAYAYSKKGDFENAILAVNRYIDLEPNEANPYDTRGDIYGESGMVEKAIASYRKALTARPDFYASLLKLAHMYVYLKDYDRADSCYKAYGAVSAENARIIVHFATLTELYQGHFNRSLEILDSLIDDIREKGEFSGSGFLFRQKAMIYLAQEEYSAAIDEFQKAIDDFREDPYSGVTQERFFYVQILASAGRYDAAEAVIDELKTDLEKAGMPLSVAYYSEGTLAYARGDYQTAIKLLERAKSELSVFYIDYWLARAYLANGDLRRAISSFENLIQHYNPGWRLSLGIWSVEMHYYLALAYEKSGWTKDAITQYEIFLDWWKDADPGIELVQKARVRLNNLKLVN